jgi:arsenate reductase (glutaredoxin)
LRDELGVELDERDYAKQPLSVSELKSLFDERGLDPREYLNPKSPAFKAMGLKDKKLTASEAIKLMASDPNLIKRPIVIAGRNLIAGFDRDRYRAALK